MGKPLSDMTLEELWELFPIFLTEHNESWNKWYDEEERRLVGILPSSAIKISHIGSTAIKDIWAKQYEKLKLSLWKKFEHDGDGYTCAKACFVAEQTAKAKKYYSNLKGENDMSKDLVPFWEKSYQEYDTIAFSNEPNTTITEFEYLISKQSKILEVGCGEGQNAIYLAQQGYQVDAFDLSEHGIAKLKYRCGM